MKYGKFLPENGTIGFVAPSFGCNIEPYKSAFENAQKVWTKEGYSLSLGPNVYEGCGIGISNTPEKCAQEFNEWYEKEDVDVLISCGGGELMCEILPYVDFEKIRQEDFYYVDKTKLIEQLLAQWGEVNVFTRPRRFGKSLNMSMFQHFFEIGSEKTLFDGLEISKNLKLCEEYQGKYPVVSISLKGINGTTYEEARGFLVKTINEEARRLSFLSGSTKLDETEQELLNQLKKKEMSNDSLVYSIRELTELLEKHYEKKVIVLIDEYDVPLAKANENGYYDEMVLLIRNLFENGLKTNKSMKFAILTGCLRVAKESIFTGLNNFKVYSITNVQFDETFGFTDTEVKEIPGVFTGGDCATGPSTVIRAIAAGKVAAHNIDEYLGYHHTLTCEAVVPEPKENMRDLMGRTEIGERPANIRKKDFEHVEEFLTHEEAMQEACRCLRCDHFGCGAMVGGRDL